MRNLSPYIQSLFDAAAVTGERSWRSQFCCCITLSDGSIYNVATGSILMTSISKNGASIDLGVDAISFEGRAVETPTLRHTQASTPDGGQIGLANMDWLISALLPEPTRLFENCKIKVYIAFPKADGAYEGILFFRGVIRTLTGDDDTASLTVISDLSDKKANVAEEITQRCLNELGDSRCGAIHLPARGTCSKDFYDAESGCTFWGQLHAFWGIPFINPTGLIAGFNAGGGGGWDGGGGGGGSGGGREGCVDPESWVKRDSGLYTKATELREGDQTLDLRGRIGMVWKVEEIYVNYRYLIELSNGARLKCSVDHPVTTDWEDEDGKQAYTLRPFIDELNGEIESSDSILSEGYGGIGLVKRWKIYALSPGKVIRVSMAPGGTRNYAAGMMKGFMIDGHNIKPVWDISLTT